MQRHPWYSILAIVALAAPFGGQARGPEAQIPRATVRELATIDGDVWEWVLLPSRNTLIYTSITSPSQPEADRSTFAWDVATKRRTLVGTNILRHSVSQQGDRLAFSRSSEDGTGDYLWTMPIDPRSGAATGPAQRVSLRPVISSGRPAFSPDGKLIAFAAGRRQEGGTGIDVTLVPATGGAERVVAHFPQVGAYSWSADGNALYVEAPTRNPPTVIFRVPLDGGRSEPLVPWTHVTNGQPIGLSPDARVAFIHENPDRFFYRTASGVEGEIAVDLPAPYDNGDTLNMRLDSMRFTAMTTVRNGGVRVVDLATGRTRDLLPGTGPSSEPAWSPDGRRLAVLSGNRSHYDISIVNADGSSPRTYSMPMHVDGWSDGVWGKPWSPDGRFLVFGANRAADGQRVGYSPYDQRALCLLDVESGQTRVLTTSSGGFGKVVWRSDGKTVRTIKWMAGPAGTAQRSVVEIALDGTERTLRDVGAEFSRSSSALISDELLLLGTGVPGERFVMPAGGGPAHQLPGGTGRRWYLGASNDGRWLLWAVTGADGRFTGVTSVERMTSGGESARILPLPFEAQRISRAAFTPDGRDVILVGKAPGDSAFKLFRVPLDGSPSRVIGEVPPGTGGVLAPSPDGTLLAYAAEGSSTTTIHEIDLGPVFQAIAKR